MKFARIGTGEPVMSEVTAETKRMNALQTADSRRNEARQD